MELSDVTSLDVRAVEAGSDTKPECSRASTH
jgi:hypothetical protein